MATVTEIDIETGVVSEGTAMLTARSSCAVTTLFVRRDGDNIKCRLNSCERLRPVNMQMTKSGSLHFVPKFFSRFYLKRRPSVAYY